MRLVAGTGPRPTSRRGRLPKRGDAIILSHLSIRPRFVRDDKTERAREESARRVVREEPRWRASGNDESARMRGGECRGERHEPRRMDGRTDVRTAASATHSLHTRSTMRRRMNYTARRTTADWRPRRRLPRKYEDRRLPPEVGRGSAASAAPLKGCPWPLFSLQSVKIPFSCTFLQGNGRKLTAISTEADQFYSRFDLLLVFFWFKKIRELIRRFKFDDHWTIRKCIPTCDLPNNGFEIRSKYEYHFEENVGIQQINRNKYIKHGKINM